MSMRTTCERLRVLLLEDFPLIEPVIYSLLEIFWKGGIVVSNLIFYTGYIFLVLPFIFRLYWPASVGQGGGFQRVNLSVL